MVSPKAIQYMLRHPARYERFLRTGRIPEGVRPQSPLITAIKRIAPIHRVRMIGFTVNPALGYQGSRQFHTVAQALLWLEPSDEVFGVFPAESWRIKAFDKAINFDDIAQRCTRVDPDIIARYSKQPHS